MTRNSLRRERRHAGEREEREEEEREEEEREEEREEEEREEERACKCESVRERRVAWRRCRNLTDRKVSLCCDDR